MSPTTGRFVTETFDYDGGRQVTVYVPPAPSASIESIVFAGDGGWHFSRLGEVFSASPGGGYQPPAVLPRPLPRVYLVAGTLEPFFLENATR
jgi:hypothetical protein